MAKKKEEPKIELKRTFNIPLRKEFMKAPKWKRSKKAVSALKEFLERHMKSANIKIGRYLNEHIWKHGIRNPPHHVKVEAEKDSEGVVKAELAGAPKEVEDKRFKKKEKKKPVKEEIKKEEKKVEEKKEEIKKEEIKEKKPEIKKEEIKKEIEKEKKEFNAKGPKRVEVPKAEELAERKEKK